MKETIQIPSFDTMTKRPAGMPFEEYKALRSSLHKALKRRLRGTLVFKAVELILDAKGRPIGRNPIDTYSRAKHGDLPTLVIE